MKYKTGDRFTSDDRTLVIKNVSGLIYLARIYSRKRMLAKEFDEVTLAEYLKLHKLVPKNAFAAKKKLELQGYNFKRILGMLSEDGDKDIYYMFIYKKDAKGNFYDKAWIRLDDFSFQSQSFYPIKTIQLAIDLAKKWEEN